MINYIEKGIGLHEAISQAGYYLRQVDGAWISDNDVEVQKIINEYNPLPDAREQAKLRIREQSEHIMSVVQSAYPDFERQTWPYQRLEIEAWTQDNTTPTPTLDAIAMSRGVDREAFLSRVTEKTSEFKALSNRVVGRKQHFSDLIDASADLAFINSVNFEL
jgi:hypothetical protein